MATATTPNVRLSSLPTVAGQAGLRGALASEFTKLRSVRSTYWTLGALFIVSVGLSVAITAGTAANFANNPGNKAGFDATQASLGAFFELGQLIIAVLGAMVITSEYSTGMMRTSLAALPRRGTVFAAKAIVFTVVALVTGLVTTFASFFVGQALISGHAPHAALGDPGVARAVAGGGLYLAALAVLSVAAGALLRRPAAAIAAMIAVLLVLPGIAQALPDSWRNPVTEFWPTQAGSQVTSVYHSAHTLQPWPGFGVMCLFVAIVYAIAWTLLDRRDA